MVQLKQLYNNDYYGYSYMNSRTSFFAPREYDAVYKVGLSYSEIWRWIIWLEIHAFTLEDEIKVWIFELEVHVQVPN